jgi:2-aminoadipate transaminase
MMDVFADRMSQVPRSFIREILKVSLDPEIISFAGGLPNKEYFPVREIQRAAERVFTSRGADVLQYSNSEGSMELRQHIAERYLRRHGFSIAPEAILITNGSQQGLDLLGKVVLNDGDGVLIEEPGYLGAIQSLSIFRPRFHPVTVDEQGMDVAMLAEISRNVSAKFLYTVPNFQNPAGLTYTDEVRRQIAQIAEKDGFLIVEDDPYGELRFSGVAQKSFYHYLPERTVLLGTFSKTIAPGFRIGWIVAPEPIREKLLIAKQAADLHTSSVCQEIIRQYLDDNDLDSHLQAIIAAYGLQCRTMVACVRKYLPPAVKIIVPDGGMFLWGKLPAGLNSMALFDHAVREKVVFVPGDPFYTTMVNTPTFRLNFSCAKPEVIEIGMQRLARAFASFAPGM